MREARRGLAEEEAEGRRGLAAGLGTAADSGLSSTRPWAVIWAEAGAGGREERGRGAEFTESSRVKVVSSG